MCRRSGRLVVVELVDFRFSDRSIVLPFVLAFGLSVGVAHVFGRRRCLSRSRRTLPPRAFRSRRTLAGLGSLALQLGSVKLACALGSAFERSSACLCVGLNGLDCRACSEVERSLVLTVFFASAEAAPRQRSACKLHLGVLGSIFSGEGK